MLRFISIQCFYELVEKPHGSPQACTAYSHSIVPTYITWLKHKYLHYQVLPAVTVHWFPELDCQSLMLLHNTQVLIKSLRFVSVAFLHIDQLTSSLFL